MLLFLTEYLMRYESGFRVFRYLTLRTILGVLTALAIALLVGPFMIRRLSHHQMAQSIRDDGPKTHLAKACTPTMGGLLIGRPSPPPRCSGPTSATALPGWRSA